MIETQSESFAQVRSQLNDLFVVRPTLYWIDFILTSVVAWFCFWKGLHTPFSSLVIKTAWTLGATFSFFRGLIFIHENFHNHKPELFVFRIFWNVFCGMVFFFPDYIYYPHHSHHGISTFSTKDDPEYIPVAFQKPFEILAPILVFTLVPLVMAIRFLIVGPVSIVIRGKFRAWVLRYASTLKMNPQFEWKDITAEEQRASVVGDLCTALLWAALLFISYKTVGLRTYLLQWYLVLYAILTVNHLRSFLRHRYTNESQQKVSFEDQILDSVTVIGFSPIATLFNPVGLRYHSVHHMFPTLPYYSLPKAHERLAATLPSDHVYHKTVVNGFWAAVWNFVRTVRTSHRRPATTDVGDSRAA